MIAFDTADLKQLATLLAGAQLAPVVPGAAQRRQAAAGARRPPPPPFGPSLASLATVLERLSVNERKGEQLRLELHRLTSRVRDSLAKLGVTSPTAKPCPTIDVRLALPGQFELGEPLGGGPGASSSAPFRSSTAL